MNKLLTSIVTSFLIFSCQTTEEVENNFSYPENKNIIFTDVIQNWHQKLMEETKEEINLNPNNLTLKSKPKIDFYFEEYSWKQINSIVYTVESMKIILKLW